MPPRKKATASKPAPDEGQQLNPAEIAAALNAEFGEGVVMLGSDPRLTVSHWPTGVLPIDVLLEGGIPRGRFVECYGDYSTLKSFVGYKAAASVQRLGGRAAIVDTEHAWDPEWGSELGIDVDKINVMRPEVGEQAIGAMEVLIRQQYDFILWDSIAATIPRQYAEAKPGDDNAPAALARIMSRGLARLTAANKVTSVFAINQTRVNVGMTYGGAGESRSGGKAMPYYASHILRFVRTGKVTEDIKVWDGQTWTGAKQVNAHKIKASLEKSKLSKPHRESWFLFDLKTAQIDDLGFLIGQALERGLITRTDSGWWDIPEVLEKRIQGVEKFREFVETNPEVTEWLMTEIAPASVSPGSPAPARSKAGGRKRAS